VPQGTAAESVEAEFSAYFRATVPGVRRYVNGLVDSSAVDDVISETFAVVWRRWSEVPADAARRRAWTFQVARHRVLHWYESESRNRHDSLEGRSWASGEDHVEHIAASDRTRRLLASLPASERDAMALVVFADLGAADAAAVLGCSTTALTTRLSRARQRLLGVVNDKARTEASR